MCTLRLLLLTALVMMCQITILTAYFPGQDDEIIHLPGLTFQTKFRQYSGYLNGSNSVMLYYWMVESENSVSDDPLVLWLNGGPGCSSLDGLLTEHGPFKVTKNGSLIRNPYSWNRIANVIYLDSPACVGFSYSTSNNCAASDDSTAALNTNALKHFLEKFPLFEGRDFYITGESYGGHYVPTLAVSVLNSKLPIKFKGIAVGNGLTSWRIIDNSNAYFAYYHGLIGDTLWKKTMSSCCRYQDPDHCFITENFSNLCTVAKMNISESLLNINIYNIYAKCETDKGKSTTYRKRNMQHNYKRNLIGNLNLNLPCIDSSTVQHYLNKHSVRQALHIPKFVDKWTVCSFSVNDLYKHSNSNMSVEYNTLFNNKDITIWIYYGDVDMACSYVGANWFFERLNRPVVSARRQWLYEDETNETQVGGFVKQFDRFTLLTVRGAGHMVPTDRPIPAFKMFKHFLSNKPL